MIIHDVEQGSDEWIELRSKYFTASEAADMMGVGHGTRDELLINKSLGLEKEFSDYVKQRIIEKGNKSEAKARPMIEEMFNIELFPVVGSEGRLLASMDGLTPCGKIIWENKDWNKELVKQVKAKKLTPLHYWQLEQQLDVTGAEKVIFSCSDGTPENTVTMEYTRVRGRIGKLNKGWDQFKEDMDNFDYSKYEAMKNPVVEKTAITDLPSISFHLNGLEVVSNFNKYKDAAMLLVERSEKKPQTDQDFADAESFTKQLKEGEKYLDQVKKNVLSEVESIDVFSKNIDELKKLLSQARLNSEKLVKKRKEEIRNEISENARRELTEHLDNINDGLDGVTIEMPPLDFATQMKQKRSLESLHSAVNNYVASIKIQNNETADKVRKNLGSVDNEFKHLFPDLNTMALKDPEDFRNLAMSRIADEVQRRETEKKEHEDAELTEQLAAAGQPMDNDEFPSEDFSEIPVEKFDEKPAPTTTQDPNKKHRFKVHTAIKATLLAYIRENKGGDEDLATTLTKAMGSGKIPRVKIDY